MGEDDQARNNPAALAGGGVLKTSLDWSIRGRNRR